MRSSRLAAAFVAFLALAAIPAQAQLFRAYLASDGSDANPCTLQQPCRLIPAALAAVQSGGEIWMLDSANYNTGPVTVGKSVSILAIPGALGSVVAVGGDALIISTTGAVTLRNLSILAFAGNENRNGVKKDGTGTLKIQDCNFSGFNLGGVGVVAIGGANVTVARSVFRDNDWGVQAINGPIVGISDSLFIGHGQVAINAWSFTSFPVRMSVTRSVVRGSAYGIFAISGTFNGSISLDVSESRIEGAGATTSVRGIGVSVDPGATAVASLSNNVVSGNEVGVFVSGPAEAKVFLSGNTITDNVSGIAQIGASIVESAGNNSVRNNTTVDVSGTITNVGRI